MFEHAVWLEKIDVVTFADQHASSGHIHVTTSQSPEFIETHGRGEHDRHAMRGWGPLGFTEGSGPETFLFLFAQKAARTTPQTGRGL